jgi:tetratricopeptide (TPR) repeat protein
MRKIWIAALFVPALAWAQPRTAEEWYKEGENQYNLGNFDKAVDAFKQGFSLETSESKKAAYLYNVAQSYRQQNDCKNALFFYKRFLALKNNDTVKPIAPKMRKDVEDRIEELEACVQQAASISKKPPNNNIAPDGEPGDKPATDGDRKPPAKDVAVSRDAEPDDDDGGSVSKRTAAPRARVLSARITGGGTKVSAGKVDVPVQATGALVAGYPIAVNDQLTVEAGAAFTYTPVPFGMNRSGRLVSLLANAGVSYEVASKISVRGDVGLGALFFSGVSRSPFTGGAETSGALSMFHLRLAASLDYAFTPNIVGTVTPIAFTYSPPKEGLADDIKSITSIDFMLGIGYRM